MRGLARRWPGATLVPKVDLLVRLGALLAARPAATTSLRATVERAKRAGRDRYDEIVGVLIAVAPAVGQARVGCRRPPKLATAIGYHSRRTNDRGAPWSKPTKGAPRLVGVVVVTPCSSGLLSPGRGDHPRVSSRATALATLAVIFGIFLLDRRDR